MLADELVEFEAAARDCDGGFNMPSVLELQGHLAAARGQWDAARARWSEAVAGFMAQGRERGACPVRAALASLDLQQGRPQDARDTVHALLLAGEQAPGGWRSLPADVIVPCCEVLQKLNDARAGAVREHLRARLEEQLASLPDETARSLLLTNEPYWRRAAQLTGQR